MMLLLLTSMSVTLLYQVNSYSTGNYQ